jgi:hypothetical protein
MSSPSSRLEAALHKLPGSVPFKAFTAALVLSAVAAYPVFSKPPEQSRQGHDYLSSDKPEAIRASQEQQRKEYRHQRNQQQQQQDQQAAAAPSSEGGSK